jgi:hypothetical protein
LRRGLQSLPGGEAAATAHRWSAGDQHPQHVVAALAHVAQAGEPVLPAVTHSASINHAAQELFGLTKTMMV